MFESRKETGAGGVVLTHNEGSMSLINAFRHVKERRPVVSPNSGFMSQLVAFECLLRGGGPTVDLEKYELHGRYCVEVACDCY